MSNKIENRTHNNINSFNRGLTYQNHQINNFFEKYKKIDDSFRSENVFTNASYISINNKDKDKDKEGKSSKGNNNIIYNQSNSNTLNNKNKENHHDHNEHNLENSLKYDKYEKIPTIFTETDKKSRKSDYSLVNQIPTTPDEKENYYNYNEDESKTEFSDTFNEDEVLRELENYRNITLNINNINK